MYAWLARHEAPFFLAGILVAVWLGWRRGPTARYVTLNLLGIWLACVASSFYGDTVAQRTGVILDSFAATGLIVAWAITGRAWVLSVMILLVLQISVHKQYIDGAVSWPQTEVRRDALLVAQIVASIVGPRASDLLRVLRGLLGAPHHRVARRTVAARVGRPS